MTSNRALIAPRYETPDPSGVMGSYGDRAIAWAKRELGIVAGPWQAYVIRKVLRYDKDGNLIHSTCLFGTGRQNGKSVIVRIIVGWMLDEGQYLPAFAEWTDIRAGAHDAKQARIAYKGVYKDLIKIPRLLEAAKGPRLEKEVRLTTQFGISLGHLDFDTLTSQEDSARGLSIGLLALDEMLTQRDWDMFQAVDSTQSAQLNPLKLMTSTAGNIESVVLRFYFDMLVRQATGDEKPDRRFWGAWWQSDDPDAGLDWDQVAKANPALHDGRLSRAFIETQYKGPPHIWRQERLNHWSDGVSQGAFGPGQWAACRVEEPLPVQAGGYALGVAVGPDWQRATVVAAALRDDGKVGTAVWRDLRSTDGVPLTSRQVVQAAREFPGDVVAVAFDKSSAGAPAFMADAEETGHPWDALTPGAVVAASMDVGELVQSGQLAVDDPLLDAQVAIAGRKSFGMEGAYRFARSASAGPIDAFLAMVYAVHAIRYQNAGSFIA